MLTSKGRSIYFALLLIALGVRLCAAVVVDRHIKSEGRQFLIEGDANGYWELGRKIANGEEYSIYTPPRRVLRTPGYPLLLAVSMKIFGENIFAASLVMATIGAGCCWLTAILARRLTDDVTALLALLIVAVSPIQIGSNIQILSETWFSFWLLLCLIAMTGLLKPRSSSTGVGRGFLTGLLTGLTTLVRPGWILWPWFGSCVVCAFGTQAFRQRLLISLLIFAGCFLALTPWAWRNHNVTGHWIFTSLWSGPSLYDGLHPDATGASDMTFVDKEDVFSTMSEFDANAHYKQRAFQFAISNPLRTAELALIKAGRYLSPTLNAAGFSGGASALFCLGWYVLFWGFVVLGAYSMRKEPGILFLLAAPFLQFLLVHMAFVGSIRYRLPVEFPLSIIAAKGLVVLQRRIQRRSENKDECIG